MDRTTVYLTLIGLLGLSLSSCLDFTCYSCTVAPDGNFLGDGGPSQDGGPDGGLVADGGTADGGPTFCDGGCDGGVACMSGGFADAGASSLCSGTSALVTLTGSLGSIQWQSQSLDGGTWSNISGATSATWITPVLSATTSYRAWVTDGGCHVASAPVTVVVSGPSTAPGSVFDATPSPASGDVCNMSSALAVDGVSASLDYASFPNYGYIGTSAVTGCVGYDFGAPSAVHVTVVAGPSQPGSCAGQCSNGCSGAAEPSLYVFEGTTLGTYSYVGSAADPTNALTGYTFSWGNAARYVVVCRPAFGPNAVNLDVDALLACP